MALQQVPRAFVKACVKRYGTFLQRYPAELRQERFLFLSQWAWMQPVVEEVQQELYPVGFRNDDRSCRPSANRQ